MRKPLLFVVCLAFLVATAGSALAYAQFAPVTGTAGILEKPGYTPEGYGPYAITDEATGAYYVVDGGSEYLDSSVGKRVIVYGVGLEGYYPPVLNLEMSYEAPLDEQPDPDLPAYGICTDELRKKAPEADLEYCTFTVLPETELSD